MGEKRWAVLYAKNSGKKKKKWLDGVLLVRGSAGRHAKVVLFDEAGSVLEEAHVARNLVCEGEEFALERFIVQVDVPVAHAPSSEQVDAPLNCATDSPDVTWSAPGPRSCVQPARRQFLPPGQRRPIDADWRDHAATLLGQESNGGVSSSHESSSSPRHRVPLTQLTEPWQEMQPAHETTEVGGLLFNEQRCDESQHLDVHNTGAQVLLAQQNPRRLPSCAHDAAIQQRPWQHPLTSPVVLKAPGSHPRDKGSRPCPEPHPSQLGMRRSASVVLNMIKARGRVTHQGAAEIHGPTAAASNEGMSHNQHSQCQGSVAPRNRCVDNVSSRYEISPSDAGLVDLSPQDSSEDSSHYFLVDSSTFPRKLSPPLRGGMGLSWQASSSISGATDESETVMPLPPPPQRLLGFVAPRQVSRTIDVGGNPTASASTPNPNAATQEAPASTAFATHVSSESNLWGRLSATNAIERRQVMQRLGQGGKPPPISQRGPLIFPMAAECKDPGSAPPVASGALVEYASLREYNDSMSAMLYEQVNLQLWQLAQRLYSLLAAGRTPSQLRALGIPLFPSSELHVYRRRNADDSTRADSASRGRRGQGWRPKGRHGAKRHCASRGGEDSLEGTPGGGSDCDAADDEALGEYDANESGKEDAPSLFLTLHGAPSEPSSANALDDLWILLRMASSVGTAINDRQPPLLVRSLWHGPSAQGRLGVALISDNLRGSGNESERLPDSSRYHALRGPNISDLIAHIDALSSLTLPSHPIVRFLLSPRAAPTSVSVRTCAPVSQLLDAAVKEFALNVEQADVLRRVTQWFDSSVEPTSPPLVDGAREENLGTRSITNGHRIDGSPGRSCVPVVLVHGAFGAGKSHLLAATLWMMRRLLTPQDSFQQDGQQKSRRNAFGVRQKRCSGQVLLASLTNVAVDNVLQVLIDHGEGDALLRIGSARRISHRVLCHSTHGRLAKTEEESIRAELRAALGRAPRSERAAIAAALAEVEGGGMAARARAVRSYPILGATCCATQLPVMQGLKCDFILLDECSQMSEPASLLPIARMGASKLLCVGDPRQLPPTLLTRPPPSQTPSKQSLAARGPRNLQPGASLPPSPRGDGGLGKTYDLSLTLFERLALCGVAPVMLRAQYRCHPLIARVASSLFYEGKLRDGLGEAAADARAPLLVGLPTLGFSQVHGTEITARDGSVANRAEGMRCVQIITCLISSGIPSEAIGVICLYRAQAILIGRMLSGGDEHGGQSGGGEENRVLADDALREVLVSTVDAFQGAERDVILVSTCRTHALGFVASPRRLNVILTRARRHLLILGSAPALLTDSRWATVLDASKALPMECSKGEPLARTTALERLLLAMDAQSSSDSVVSSHVDNVHSGHDKVGLAHQKPFEQLSVARSEGAAHDVLPILNEMDNDSKGGTKDRMSSSSNWMVLVDEDELQAQSDATSRVGNSWEGMGASIRLKKGDEALYHSGDGSFTKVLVIALHYDDPEGGVYVTIQFPDGRERHTELSRVLSLHREDEAAYSMDLEADGELSRNEPSFPDQPMGFHKVAINPVTSQEKFHGKHLYQGDCHADTAVCDPPALK